MTPRPPAPHVTNRGPAYAEAKRELSLRRATREDGGDGGFREFSRTVPLPVGVPLLRAHIGQVIRVRPKKQVRDITTGGLVATVQHVRGFVWNRAVRVDPRESMDPQFWLTLASGQSVAAAIELALPDEARRLVAAVLSRPKRPLMASVAAQESHGVAFGGAIPRARLAGDWRRLAAAALAKLDRFGGHRRLHSFGVTAPATTIARGHSCVTKSIVSGAT